MTQFCLCISLSALGALMRLFLHCVFFVSAAAAILVVAYGLNDLYTHYQAAKAWDRLSSPEQANREFIVLALHIIGLSAAMDMLRRMNSWAYKGLTAQE